MTLLLEKFHNFFITLQLTQNYFKPSTALPCLGHTHTHQAFYFTGLMLKCQCLEQSAIENGDFQMPIPPTPEVGGACNSLCINQDSERVFMAN